MNSAEHIGIGLAASEAVGLIIPQMKPDSVLSLASALLIASVGSTVPDIDSNAASKPKKAVLTIIAVLLVGTAAVMKLAPGAMTEIGVVMLKHIKPLQIAGIAVLLISIIIGLRSSHRTFTHQLIGLLAFSAGIFLTLGTYLGLWFMVAMASHQFADMLNYGRIEWLFPVKKNFSRKLFKSQSFPASILGIACSTAAVLLLIYKYKTVVNL